MMNEDRAKFEAIATTLVHETSVASEQVKEFEQALKFDNGTSKSVETLVVTPNKSKELMPFHCLMSQQQRERLFTAINQAKSSYELNTTAEALDTIAQEYLNAQ